MIILELKKYQKILGSLKGNYSVSEYEYEHEYECSMSIEVIRTESSEEKRLEGKKEEEE
jgi:hypothetical protein